MEVLAATVMRLDSGCFPILHFFMLRVIIVPTLLEPINYII